MKRQREFIHLTGSLGNTSNKASDCNFEWSLQPTGSNYFTWLDTSAFVEEHTGPSAQIEFKCQGSMLAINPTAWLKFKPGDRLSAWYIWDLLTFSWKISRFFHWMGYKLIFYNDTSDPMSPDSSLMIVSCLWDDSQRSLWSIPCKVMRFFLSFKAFRPALGRT